jgi:cytochrome P450
MWYVGRDQDVQRRLADDALARLGSSRLPHDYESAAGLAYAEAVLREVLRLRSAVPFIALEARRETEVMGVRVPANGRLLLLTRMATVQDQSFSSGSSFDPSRWMTKDHERVHDSSAFLTFGAGPRFCPGRNVALLEGKSVLGTIARNFEVSIADPSARVRERFRFAMEPVGLRIKLRERT